MISGVRASAATSACADPQPAPSAGGAAPLDCGDVRSAISVAPTSCLRLGPT
jgi:hypothetical protein